MTTDSSVKSKDSFYLKVTFVVRRDELFKALKTVYY
jgi:hypothetical protein